MSIHLFDSSNREQFMANRRPGTLVRVVRMPTVPLVIRNEQPEFIPAVELTYSFIQGDEEWVFHELRLAAENGEVDLRDTLWAQLEREGGCRLLHRSGSF